MPAKEMSLTLKFKLSCLLPCMILMAVFFDFSNADVLSAIPYGPPYIPTACYGMSTSDFPGNNMFAKAGDGLWDNGAACGRVYLVRCLSSSRLNACRLDQTIRVKVVDHASRPNVLVLSANAFASITNPAAAPTEINIEFQKV